MELPLSLGWTVPELILELSAPRSDQPDPMPCPSVGHRSSGYSALANTSPSTAQPHKADDDEVPHEMKELLPRDAGGPETSSSFTGKGSVETAIAGCEEDDDGGRSFGRTK